MGGAILFLAHYQDLAYNLEMTEKQETPDKKTDASVTRRELAKKIAYVAPTVLAIIAATERPALADSNTIY